MCKKVDEYGVHLLKFRQTVQYEEWLKTKPVCTCKQSEDQLLPRSVDRVRDPADHDGSRVGRGRDGSLTR